MTKQWLWYEGSKGYHIFGILHRIWRIPLLEIRCHANITMGKTDRCLTITNHINARNVCVILGMYWSTELPPNVTDDTLRRITSSLCENLRRLCGRFRYRYGYHNFVTRNEYHFRIATVDNEANMVLSHNHLHDNVLIYSYTHLQLFLMLIQY